MESKEFKQLKVVAVDYAQSSGLMIKEKQTNNYIHAPFSLFPTKFPKQAFEQATKLQPIFNKLFDRISRNHEFIKSVMEQIVSNGDPFQSKLYEIYLDNYYSNQTRQTYHLGLHRSDYMLDKNNNLKQVEFNTIASGLCSLSTKTNQLHQYLQSYSVDFDMEYPPNILDNPCIDAVPNGISKAHEVFCKHHFLDTKEYSDKSVKALMVVQSQEWNMFDQRHVEFTLWKNHRIPLIRKTLQQIYDESVIDDHNNLIINDDTIVSVVYFRAGYSPQEYTSSLIWESRSRIEQSNAIKAPNITYHIIGAKKFQQVLSQPGVIEMFLDDSNEIQLVKDCFTGLYPVDDKQTILNVIGDQPDRYVLKPQREGGGNNIYGKEIIEVINDPETKDTFILMDLIDPLPLSQYLVVNSQIYYCSVICELGIFGIYLGNENETVLNYTGGHLLRTKDSSNNEGGVSVGKAVIDSPFLV